MTPSQPAGRYAPTPSGDLHVGNFRTAVVAWLMARSTGRRFVMRVENVDEQRTSAAAAERQLEDLAALGLDWDGPELWQSQRYGAYQKAVGELRARGLVYECYCSRRDIQEAVRAPHSVPGEYPGTCRDLSEDQRRAKREELARAGRHPALRLRADTRQWQVSDALLGTYSGRVDDLVLRRGGREPGWAYNLAVVVDDAYQGVDQVCRGEDLASSAPGQAYLAHLLGLPQPSYVHVPLVLSRGGQRLAKRDGAVTLRQLRGEHSMSTADVVEMIGESLGVPGAGTVAEILERWSLEKLPREPYRWEAPE